ncbi:MULTISPECIES: nuclear transport factor 2 family protein [unclassified Streptomyces]|uniref:nuclear transport factor 2 family protein n=1 Tax=unclassified Streptomyces TaxID=2593676 RepID=UPI0038239C5E
MDPFEQLLAERACQRLLLDLVRRFDHGEPGSVAELFTEDGTWAWPAGNRLVRGRAALRTYFGTHPARPAHARRGTGTSTGTGTGTGLVMSSVQVEVTSPDTASATSYFTAFLLGGGVGADLDVPAHSHARGAAPAPAAAARTPYTPYTSRVPHAPAPAPAPVRIGHYEDRFHRSPAHGGTWLLERRTVFLPPDAPPPPL